MGDGEEEEKKNTKKRKEGIQEDRSEEEPFDLISLRGAGNVPGFIRCRYILGYTCAISKLSVLKGNSYCVLYLSFHF